MLVPSRGASFLTGTMGVQLVLYDRNDIIKLSHKTQDCTVFLLYSPGFLLVWVSLILKAGKRKELMLYLIL